MGGMIPFLSEEEVVHFLRQQLKDRRVKIVTEQDFGAVVSEEGVFPAIMDEEIFRKTINVDYKARFLYFHPLLTILLLDVEKEGKERKREKFAFLFLPKQFHLAEAIGMASMLGIGSERQGKVTLFSLGPNTRNEVKILTLMRDFNSIFPGIVDICHNKALEVLRVAFPGADWLVEYYTRGAQVEGDEV